MVEIKEWPDSSPRLFCWIVRNLKGKAVWLDNTNSRSQAFRNARNYIKRNQNKVFG